MKLASSSRWRWLAAVWIEHKGARGLRTATGARKARPKIRVMFQDRHLDRIRDNACTYVLAILTLVAGCQRSPAVPVKANAEHASAAGAETLIQQPPPPAPGITESNPRAIDDRIVLAVAPATVSGELNYEVSIGTCVAKECPVQVSLLEGDKVLDQKKAAWASTTREPVREEVGAGWGVGDPVGPPANVTAWATGEEEKYLGTAVRTVRLGRDTIGLLVDQLSGFEHLKRHHELFVAADRKLERAWAAKDGAGPAWTSTAIVSAGEGRDTVVFFSGFRYPGSDEPDTLSASVLTWDANRHGLVRQKGAPLVQAAVIRGFSSVEAAQKARSAHKDCLGGFWVLPAAQFGERGKRGFVLAIASVTREQAQAAARCAEDMRPDVIPMP